MQEMETYMQEMEMCGREKEVCGADCDRGVQQMIGPGVVRGVGGGIASSRRIRRSETLDPANVAA